LDYTEYIIKICCFKMLLNYSQPCYCPHNSIIKFPHTAELSWITSLKSLFTRRIILKWVENLSICCFSWRCVFEWDKNTDVKEKEWGMRIFIYNIFMNLCFLAASIRHQWSSIRYFVIINVMFKVWQNTQLDSLLRHFMFNLHVTHTFIV
jgi:hypothetical protein